MEDSTSLDITGRVLSPAVAKEHGQEIAKAIADAGNSHPVDDFIKFRYARDAFDAAMRWIEPATLDEIDNGIPYERFGVSVKYRPGRTVYSYRNDSVWNELNSQLESLKEQMKQREAYLRGLPNAVANMDTGEVDRPPEVASITKESVVISDPRYTRPR